MTPTDKADEEAARLLPFVRRNEDGSYVAVFDGLLAGALDLIASMKAERDTALARVEELEASGEAVSVEFEKDCWVAMRALLNECGFDWRDVDTDGVTADDAREYIRETLKDYRSRAEAAEAQLATLKARLAEVEGALLVLDTALGEVESVTYRRRDDRERELHDMAHKARTAVDIDALLSTREGGDNG